MLQRICQPESTTILNNTLDDANALIELLDKMQPYIWKSLNHFSIHPNEKEDLQQEILFKVFKALSQFDFSKETPLAHYVNRIIKNTKNRSEEHTSELQSRFDLVCRLLLEKKKQKHI